MKVAARRGNRAVPEGGLYQVDRGAALQAVRGVRVPQPMGRDGHWQARPLGRALTMR